jgi:hypothetical protein
MLQNHYIHLYLIELRLNWNLIMCDSENLAKNTVSLFFLSQVLSCIF